MTIHLHIAVNMAIPSRWRWRQWVASRQLHQRRYYLWPQFNRLNPLSCVQQPHKILNTSITMTKLTTSLAYTHPAVLIVLWTVTTTLKVWQLHPCNMPCVLKSDIQIQIATTTIKLIRIWIVIRQESGGEGKEEKGRWKGKGGEWA